MQEAIDGDLAARAFGLLQVLEGAGSQARCRERSRQRLEMALLAFFQAFRKVYIGEHVMHATKVCKAQGQFSTFRGCMFD